MRSKQLRNNAVDFRDLKGVKSWSRLVPVTGSAPDSGAALLEADPVPLARRGTISIYGKCYRNETIDFVFAGVFARTSVDGALFRSGIGQPVRLNTTSDEAFRALGGSSDASANQVEFSEVEFESSPILAADHRVAVSVISHSAAKNGSPAVGNAPFGAGDRCSFSGYLIG